MNVFLTGSIQVGKSTIIRKWLSAHPDLRVGGFQTVWNGDRHGPDASLHIIPADGTGRISQENMIKSFRREGNERTATDYPEVYDAVGTKILENVRDCDIIVMDEVGPGENEALRFHRAVLDTLHGPVPVIGVVRALPGVLTDAVRACRTVRTVTVTAENRDRVLEELLNEWPVSDGT